MLSLSGRADADYAPPIACDEPSDVEGSPDSRPPAIDARQLVRDLKAFRTGHLGRSAWELAITLVPFTALCALTLLAVQAGYFVALVLTVPAGLFLLRLFLIQHDCGHGAFLASRAGNDWLGRMLGVLTFTPYDCWRRAHALHHAGTGNLDARGFGDIDTLSVREFQALSPARRLLYRFYRHPFVLLGIGPAYLFLLRHRLPIGLMNAGRIYWISALATNAATALLIVLIVQQFGLAVSALVLLPVLLIAASAGVWLFYIQHQFEDAHWDERENWSFHEAALRGSSYLELPPVLRWFSANIGVHHVHHLASSIPFYRLPEVLSAYPVFKGVNRFTMRQTFATWRLALWDEDQRRLVPFPSAKRPHTDDRVE